MASRAPRYSREHWAARALAVGEMFTTAGVDASTERVLLYVRETAWIPWAHPPEGYDRREYFQRALSKALREKDGDFQTAPQVSSIWRAFRDLLPKSEWRHYPGSPSLPPKWSKTAERLQDRLDQTAGEDTKALASGVFGSAADQLQDAWDLQGGR